MSRASGQGAMSSLLARPQFELVPVRGALEAARALPAGATVTVTVSSRGGTAATVELVERLSARGFWVVPHLAARQFRDDGELSDVLDRLDRAGVRAAFVVAGDADPPAGPFPDGLSLLRAMDRIGHRLTSIGVPSYPEGHPAIDDSTLWSALRAKQAFANYTVTQMCFDPDAVCRFVASARGHGITLPVVVGVPGAVDTGKLLRIGMRIGVGESIRFAKGHLGIAGELLRPGGYRPDGLVHSLAERTEARTCELAGLHIYTFNQVEATLAWLHRARRNAVA
jgi:methylenetetrahydrofolate reductase (NADH)